MAKSSNVLNYQNLLGYKLITRDGYLVRADDQGQTIGYADMFQISGNDLFIQTDRSVQNLNQTYIRDLKNLIDSLPVDVNLISIPNFLYQYSHQQKTYFNQRMEKIRHKIVSASANQLSTQHYKQLDQRMHLLSDQINKQKIVARNLIDYTFVLVAFSHQKSTLKKLLESLINQDSTISVKPLTKAQKWNILYHIRNPFSHKWMQPNQIPSKIKEPIFKFNCFEQDKTYFALMNVNHIDMDNNKVPLGFLSHSLMQRNVITCISIGTQFDIKDSFMNNQNPFLYNFKNAFKPISLHYLLYAPSFNSLVGDINHFKDFFTAFHLIHITGKRNQKINLRAFYQPIKEQSYDHENNVKIISTDQIADGYPINFSHIKNKHGCYLGYTKHDGQINYNQFNDFDNPLCRSNISLIIGDRGQGKSTLAKSMLSNAFMMGCKVYNLDLNNNYEPMIKHYCGSVCKDKTIDLFHIYQIADKSNGFSKQENIMSNINRIVPAIVNLSRINLGSFKNNFVKCLEHCYFSGYLKKDPSKAPYSIHDFLDEAIEHPNKWLKTSDPKMIDTCKKLEDMTAFMGRNSHPYLDDHNHLTEIALHQDNHEAFYALHYLTVLQDKIIRHHRKIVKLAKEFNLSHDQQKHADTYYINIDHAEYFFDNSDHPELNIALNNFLDCAMNNNCYVTLVMDTPGYISSPSLNCISNTFFFKMPKLVIDKLCTKDPYKSHSNIISQVVPKLDKYSTLSQFGVIDPKVRIWHPEITSKELDVYDSEWCKSSIQKNIR